MKTLPILVIVVLALALLGRASGQQAAEKLRTELETALKEQPQPNPNPEEAYLFSNALRELKLLSEPRTDPDWDPQSLRQISVSAPNERIREAAVAVLDESARLRVQREAALRQRVTKTMTDALKAALAAETAEALDEPLASIGKILIEDLNFSRSPQMQQVLQQAQGLNTFIRHLQDLLAGLVENPSLAREVANLQQQVDFSNLVPRSQILARIKAITPAAPPPRAFPGAPASNAEFDALLENIKTLEDLPRAKTEIEKITASGRAVPYEISNQLNAIIRTYDQLKNGTGTSAMLYSLANQGLNGGAASGQLGRLTTQLINYGLPLVLELPPAEAPDGTESRAAYFNRVMKLAKERQDWTLLARVIDASQKLGAPIVASPADTNGYTSFLGGLNHERAHQYAFAVVSYLSALGSGSRVVPVERVGERLEQLKKEHPEDYEKGLSMALPPPKQQPLSQDGERVLANPNARDRNPILAPPQTGVGAPASPASTLGK